MMRTARLYPGTFPVDRRRAAGIILSIIGMLFLLGTGAAQRAQAQTYAVLHNFSGSNGANPFGGLVADSSGNLYGTTLYGGIVNSYCPQGCGTVFRLDGSGGGFTVLHSFSGTDGALPSASLLLDSSTGTLYGTTYGGFSPGDGTVFRLDTSGSGFAVLHSFSGSDGELPNGQLVMDSSGSNLYGTTIAGTGGWGTVFTLSTSGSGFTVLHNFSADEAKQPYAGVVRDSSGNLYGTTAEGGSYTNCGSGCGTVFKLDTSFTLTILHNFAGGTTDGASPFAGLVMDSSGNLYGMTAGGGTSGNGTVFKLDTSGGGFTVLHNFAGGTTDGANPYKGLVMDSAGTLYGTTTDGGYYGYGTVFQLDTSTGVFKVLYNFVGGTTDGANPYAGLVMDSSGNLYGTTFAGGSSGDGTVFELSLSNTPAGSNVSVTPTDTATSTSPVSLTFSSITQAGNTTLTTSNSGPAVPQGFKLGSPATYYNLATTATYSGSITICIDYSGVSFQTPGPISIWHYDTTAAAWTQLATTDNTTTTTACAPSPSLSPFALLESAYAAQVQSPISADGTSVFSANRGVVPVKFTLTYGGASTCQLPPATISLIRTAGSTLGSVDQSDYQMAADSGSNFRIDTSSCQYVYNLDSSSLGAGMYQVNISIDDNVVGSGTFGLQ